MAHIVTDAACRRLGEAGAIIDLANGHRPLSWPNKPRRVWLLRRLADADGPSYDRLCREVFAAFPAGTRYWTSCQAVRSVRDLLFDELATVERDGSIWLTSAGWTALAALTVKAGAR